MEKPVMPNPETMTDAEFDKWLEDEYIWEAEQIEKTLFPNGIPEDTSTPEGIVAGVWDWRVIISIT